MEPRRRHQPGCRATSDPPLGRRLPNKTSEVRCRWRAKRAIKRAPIEEAARAVLAVLEARGIDAPDTTRERILAEKDRARLERWLVKAVTASSVVEVMGRRWCVQVARCG